MVTSDDQKRACKSSSKKLLSDSLVVPSKALQPKIKENVRKLYKTFDQDSVREVKDQNIDKCETKEAIAVTFR